MFKKLNILEDSDKHLRMKSKEVTFPLTKEDKQTIQQIIKHLTYSQIEEYSEKYDLRPGMGLAFPQLGKNIRIIVIVHEVDDEVFDNYVMINPVIISHSEEMIAVETGEGCLSVNESEPNQEGYVKRSYRIIVEGYSYFEKKVVRHDKSNYVAIVLQHELDHLEGKLFIDHIDKKHP